VRNDSTETVPPTVPKELKERQQWVCWRYEPRAGKLTKVPYSPQGGPASATDATTWTSYEAAVTALREGNHDGVGFVLSLDDPFTAIDLDACRNSETGELAGWAQEIVDAFDSYAEISPSRSGIHVFIRGDLPPGGNKRGPIEMYSASRFFTFSGKHIAGTPLTIEERSAKLAKLHRRVFGEPTSANGHGPRGPGNVLSDSEILARARQAANGEAFEKLWAGDATDYASSSEADLALCSRLVFWTGGDPDRVDNMFRQSGLHRPKWDERHYGDGRTYGQATIEKALEDATEFYAAAHDGGWEDPVPLPEGLPPVAQLDPVMIPEPLRGWLVDLSERMQIPPDFAAVGAVVVTGSLIGRKVGIHPKRHDDWLVVPNLWGAVVGRPSLLKSPALAEVMKPLSRLMAEAYEEHNEKKRTHETDVMVHEATKAALKDELKKAAKSGDRSKLEEIARGGQDAEGPEEPVLRRYKTEDATVEKISEILLENPRGILVHRDELSRDGSGAWTSTDARGIARSIWRPGTVRAASTWTG
jgi:putative DNA primase/helicase